MISAVPPQAVAPSLPRKLWHKLTLELRALPYLLGLKEPCQDFRNLEIVDETKALKP